MKRITNRKRIITATLALLIAGAASAQSFVSDRVGERFTQFAQTAKLASIIASEQRATLESLNLTAEQKEALLKIQSKRLENAKDLVDDNILDQVKLSLEAGEDPGVAALLIQKQVDKAIAIHRDVTAEMIDFYRNELTVDQQTAAREAMLARIEKLEKVRNAVIDLLAASAE